MVSKTDRQTGAKTIYTYDLENQLIRIDFPDGTWVTYRYDGLGRRFEKNVNGQITRYIYDNEDIHLEYDGANQLKAAYVHGIGIDEPLIMYRGGKSYYYHADGLGSIVQLTDAQGNVVKSYIYNSFGNVVKETGSIENPYTYTGRERDVESGLYYYRARYYDALQGRFLSLDPVVDLALLQSYPWSLPLLKDPFQFHGYSYVENNPISYLDPYGLSTYYFQRFAKEVEEWRWKWSWVVPTKSADVAGTAFTLGNPALNLVAGGTGRSGVSLPPHATTWQHKLGSGLTTMTKNPWFSRAGRLAGRAALLPTIWEGFWNLGTIIRASITAISCDP